MRNLNIDNLIDFPIPLEETSSSISTLHIIFSYLSFSFSIHHLATLDCWKFNLFSLLRLTMIKKTSTRTRCLSPMYHQSHLIKIFSNHKEWWAVKFVVDGNIAIAREGNKNKSSISMDLWVALKDWVWGTRMVNISYLNFRRQKRNFSSSQLS